MTSEHTTEDAIGKCSNLKLYRGNNENTFKLFYAADSDFIGSISEYNGNEIRYGLDRDRIKETYTPKNSGPGHIDTLEVEIDLENIVPCLSLGKAGVALGFDRAGA